MFKSLLASLGLGAAKIDLILDRSFVVTGKEVTGKIVIAGGDVKQILEGLYVDFILDSRYTVGESTRHVSEVVQRISIFKDDYTIQPQQNYEVPFSFQCPQGLPVSSVCTRYYFQTNLEIKQGIDSHDRDYIDVRPTGLLRNFLAGFSRLGFVHHAEGYTGEGGKQIIQFRPTTWLHGEYDEILFDYRPGETEQGIGGFYELDKKTRGIMGVLADSLDLDESQGQYYFSREQLATEEKAEETIRQFIIEKSQNLAG
jgi:sporulation-control protein